MEQRIRISTVYYSRNLAWQRRILAVNRDGEREFIRFYDFGVPLLRFNILEIDWSQQPPQHRLQGTPLHPWRRAGVERAVEAAGFGAVEIYGDMRWGEYTAAKSQNLVVTAKK